MSRKFFKVMHDWLPWIASLSDAEKGRLFEALIKYSAFGETPSLPGAERAIFPLMAQVMDADSRKHNAKCEQNRANVLKRYDRTKNATNVYDRIRPYEKEEKEEAPLSSPLPLPPTPPITIPPIIPPEEREEQVDDDDDDLSVDAHARIFSDTIIACYLSNFGERPSPAVVDSIARVSKQNADLACHAIELAALMGAKSPLSYIAALFDQWRRSGVHSIADVQALQAQFDIRRGKLILPSAVLARKELMQ